MDVKMFYKLQGSVINISMFWRHNVPVPSKTVCKITATTSEFDINRD